MGKVVALGDIAVAVLEVGLNPSALVCRRLLWIRPFASERAGVHRRARASAVWGVR